MTNEDWLTNLTRRVEELEEFKAAHDAVEGERATGTRSRQWAFNTALTAINTLVLLASFWVSHK